MSDRMVFALAFAILVLLPVFTYPTTPESPVRMSVSARIVLFLLTAGLLMGPVVCHYSDLALFLNVVGILTLPFIAMWLSENSKDTVRRPLAGWPAGWPS